MECPSSLPVSRRARRPLVGGFAWAATALVIVLVAPLAAGPASPGLEPAATGGVETLDRALARLSTHRRLLMIAAHPDDEDTRLLARLGRGDGAEVAYLSLTRGEGGQNLIGPELGDGLGLLRSRELLAARGVDGARQFFARAYDFGYTRSREEAFERWGEEALLEDTVRVIRAFRPQVVVSVWPADARAGHGQHQVAGLIASRAFATAGDPQAQPSLAAEGLPPWSPSALYRPAWFEPDAAAVTLDFGVLDPHGGRSVLQLAAASRSLHRSQDMGTLQPLGEAEGRYLRLDREVSSPRETDLFAGVDTRLEAIADLLDDAPLRADIADRLRQVAALAVAAREALVPAHLDRAVEPLGLVVGLLDAARLALGTASPSPGSRHALRLVEEKLRIAEEALATAAGVAVDAWTARSDLVAGTRFEVEAVMWNAGERSVQVKVIEVSSPAGLAVVGVESPEPVDPSGRFRLAAQPTRVDRLEVAVPDSALPTIPYFLRAPRTGDRYIWDGVPNAVRGLPFGPPPLIVRFRLEIDGVAATLEREVVWRYADQARGEAREPLRVVPPLEVRLTPGRLVWSLDRSAAPGLTAEVTSHLAEKVAVRLVLHTPAGWPPIPPIDIALAARGHTEVPLELTLPPGLAPGRYLVRAEVIMGARRWDEAIDLVAYPHIRSTPMPVRAETAVHVGTIALPRLGRVAYVRGASDRVPEALSAVGVPIEVYDAESLGAVGLDGFDAVVIGSRAYETDVALAGLDSTLDAYLRGGGTVIVQYQQYGYVGGGHAPFPFDINRPHDRATDERTPVRALVPEHPVFQRPNTLGSADWEDWVQERGLYFAGTWDKAYTPLLAMADPEGVERSGALLVVRVEKGWFVYTGLAFFRQLPAGVVGAYRLFANLLALATEDR